MSKTNENIQNEYLDFDVVIREYDDIDKKGIDELEISRKLKLLKPDLTKDISKFRYEIFAFDVIENFNQSSFWGTFFGPITFLDKGEYPSLKILNKDAIEYFEYRSKESKSPLLIARYSDLIWDLKAKICEVSPDPIYARNAINAYLNIVQEGYYKYLTNGINKLKRALHLAIKLKDIDLIEQVKDSILLKEDSLINENSKGLWGFSYDFLMNNKGLNLSSDEIQRIIQSLENRFSFYSDLEESNINIDPWAAEAAANRLIEYYKKQNNLVDLNRIVLGLGKCFEGKSKKLSAMQATGMLELAFRLYKQFGFKSESTQILIKLRELGPKVNSEMKPISATYEMSNVKMKKYIDSMCSGNVDDILKRIIYQYIPLENEAIKQIENIRSKAPISFIFRHQMQDDKGRIVATIGSLNEDIKGHIVKRISENLLLTSVFLREVLKEAKEKKGFSKSTIIAHLKQSPIFEESRYIIIEKAIDSYFEGDFFVFIHLIIPQIEEAIRNLIELLGGNVLKPSTMEGYDLRTLNDLLNDIIIKEALEDDLILYFKILLVDKRGWNLRNRICHGIASLSLFNQDTSDRILHLLLCIGLIREVED